MNTKFDLIRAWAEQRGLYAKGDVKTQYVKLGEEFGELGKAIIKDDKAERIDAIGDMVVVLTNLAHLDGLRIEDCIDSAYEVIAKRTGSMINGSFVKDEQINPEITEKAFKGLAIEEEWMQTASKENDYVPRAGDVYQCIKTTNPKFTSWNDKFEAGKFYESHIGELSDGTLIADNVNMLYLDNGNGYKFYVDYDCFKLASPKTK